MAFARKRYTRTDVGVAFAQLMEEVRLAGHPTADRWHITMGSNGFHYELQFTESSTGFPKQAKLGGTAREATHYLEAMRDGMMILRKMREEEAKNGTD